jgi:hypothetical protein
MKTTLKYSGLLVASLGIFLLAFLWGRSVGVKSANYSFTRVAERVTNLNALAAYNSHAKISEKTAQVGTLEEARCLAELAASAFARQVKVCLGNAECKPLIYDEVKVDAPELLESSIQRFHYYREGESCQSGS